MYTETILLVVLIVLIYHTPSVIVSLSNTRIGKLILVVGTVLLATHQGRNTGVLASLITIMLLHKGVKEGMTHDDSSDDKKDTTTDTESEDSDAETEERETIEEIHCKNEDCSGVAISISSEEEEKPKEAKPTDDKEGFLGSKKLCDVLTSSRLSLGEALRSISSNKLPVSSDRGNGSGTCPKGTICPQMGGPTGCKLFS